MEDILIKNFMTDHQPAAGTSTFGTFLSALGAEDASGGTGGGEAYNRV